MRAKSLILFVIAVGCGLAASIGVSQYLETAAGSSQVEVQPILVALTDVKIGQQLDAQTVKLEEWPKDRIPDGAVYSFDAIEGKYPRGRMYAGEPILQAKLMDANHNNAVNHIPKGYRSVAVKVTAETSGELIQPGDRVDVLVLLRKSEEVPETGTRTILRDVTVFSVDGATERSVDETGQARNLNTVSLLLKPKQAESVTLAKEIGRLFLTLRRPDDDEEDTTTGETIRSLLRRTGEDGSEDGDSPDGFADWLANGSAPPERTPAITLTPVAQEGPKWKMVILGSNGSQEYHWMDEDQMPITGAFAAVDEPVADDESAAQASIGDEPSEASGPADDDEFSAEADDPDGATRAD